jgi:gliding motility-associated-like protein
LACYETATYNTATCQWDVTGSQPAQPTLACDETAVFNATTCQWDVTQNPPAQPALACYETATYNTATCQWDVSGSQPAQPTLACDETAVFNTTTCQWDVTQNPPAQPALACYETATYNTATCQWDVTGSQPAQPTLACDETAVFNATTCQWDITQNPPPPPPLACYETATYNTATCQWDVTGSQPAQPTLACDETAVFNATTCQWDIAQNPPAQPPLACYETATYNTTTCQWDVTGSQPVQPSLACYETAVFNSTTCIWEVSGEQPEAPITECYETAVFNTVTCSWDVSGEPIDFMVSGVQPTCTSQFGSLVLTGLAPNTTYTVAYNQGVATSYTSNQDGEVIINSLSGGTYTNFTVGIGGCTFENSAIIELIEIELPEVYAGEDQAICEGEEVILFAANYGAASITWSGGVQDGVGFYLVPGVYSYTVNAELNNCTAQDEVQIEVFAKPTIDAGEDVSVCTGNPVILVADYNQGSIISWDNAIQDGIAFTPSISQYYTVTATSSIGCVNSDSVFVAVLDLPAVGFNSNEIVGCAPLQVQFESIQVNENVTCIWDFGNGTTSTICDNPVAYYDSPGCYPVSLTVQSSETGCSSSVTYEDMICVAANPIADFYTNTTTITATDSYVQTTNVSSGATSYYWDFGNGVTSSEYAPNVIYDALSDGYVISLVVENDYGCVDTAQVFIVVEEELIFYVPNAFTPDNDQYNQVFQPVFTSGFTPSSYQLLIFNRWGELIFESFDHTIGWDGSYGRNREVEMCQDGTYIWKIYFKSSNNDERKSVTGHVSLLR